MKTKDLQKLAYLYLSSSKDRKILLGKVPMKYCDFRRLTYLTSYIGFDEYASCVWKNNVEQFVENINAYEQIQEEKRFSNDSYEDFEDMIKEEADWVKDFIKNAPFQIRKWLQEYLQGHDQDWKSFEEIFEKGNQK